MILAVVLLKNGTNYKIIISSNNSDHYKNQIRHLFLSFNLFNQMLIYSVRRGLSFKIFRIGFQSITDIILIIDKKKKSITLYHWHTCFIILHN